MGFDDRWRLSSVDAHGSEFTSMVDTKLDRVSS